MNNVQIECMINNIETYLKERFGRYKNCTHLVDDGMRIEILDGITIYMWDWNYYDEELTLEEVKCEIDNYKKWQCKKAGGILKVLSDMLTYSVNEINEEDVYLAFDALHDFYNSKLYVFDEITWININNEYDEISIRYYDGAEDTIRLFDFIKDRDFYIAESEMFADMILSNLNLDNSPCGTDNCIKEDCNYWNGSYCLL